MKRSIGMLLGRRAGRVVDGRLGGDGFLPVRLAEERSTSGPRAVSVVTASGHRIEGLDAAGATVAVVVLEIAAAIAARRAS